MRLKIAALFLFALALVPGIVFAQNTSVQFNRWDAKITPRTNSDQMDIAETQEVNVTGGTVSHGSRFWTDPVQIQNVYVVLGNGGNAQALSKGSASQPGTYNVTQSGNRTTLNYTLPAPQSSGSTFVVQINYTATSPTTGMVDWKVVPAEHDFVVNSSTVQIQLPNGQAPDSTLVRASQSDANVQVNGNQIVIRSAGQIPAQQSFAIQVPFGTGVGGAAGSSNGGQFNPNTNPNSNNNPAAQNQPGDSTSVQLPGLGSILPILCILGVILLFGGGALLRNLLGGFLGGGGPLGGFNRGPFVGGPSNDPFSGNAPTVQRGFRQSANQDREIGNVGNDKESGGGASFG